jgi:hypothetical protein
MIMRTVEIDHRIGASWNGLKVPADLALGDMIGVNSVCGWTGYTVVRTSFDAQDGSQRIVGRTTAGTERWFHAK